MYGMYDGACSLSSLTRRRRTNSAAWRWQSDCGR